MRLLIVIILNVLALVIMPVVAVAQQSLVQDPVAFEKEHFTKRCEGQASFGDHFSTDQDINNDKLMDVVINEGEITCKGEKGPDCTDEGCTYNFYIRVEDGGYLLIATARIYGYDFIQRFGNMVLVMKMHPKYCNRTEGDPCLMTVRVRGTQFVTISTK
ncbi:hypothetical protein DTW90_06185 [Neorhizobium sp. P12A]|uniref:hypothetical protein n=1 Tax=Neorhizobium sp. P12A TaxID=2268027 RepID=UPI0011EBD1B6|nr:hypothetical protein [Neorhizobium sp. P12A]KAA0699039.1 hypothetical protein DTW90_06185 [Neorhizobium sp. P12A]